MAFDCYCAICGVGFSGMHIEHPSQTALERRRKWIAKRASALQAGKDISQLSQEEDEAPIRSYDPRIVDFGNIEWLYKAHCLAVDEKPNGMGNYSYGNEAASGPALPFHWCCFEILTRMLTGSTDTSNLNLDVLYNIMSALSNASSSALHLSYGDDIRHAQGRYWECIPGAEASNHIANVAIDPR
ncbi:hypothetical protein EYZ11_012296 [Aspergillus tanneri]|uniref:Uncharacterized protein n=1 Tax=Aspergillus tanneri TaxID=1220188 RepID=A0A4V3UMR2_9EURO|nr:hypothetical protein EYZ11_012296 [Aspergillus tanneri]